MNKLGLASITAALSMALSGCLGYYVSEEVAKTKSMLPAEETPATQREDRPPVN